MPRPRPSSRWNNIPDTREALQAFVEKRRSRSKTPHRSQTMDVVDAQVHVFDECDLAGRPDPGGALAHARSFMQAVTADAMDEAMDEAGVDAAVLVTTALYGWDNSYALD